jgi:hypothetical protein
MHRHNIASFLIFKGAWVRYLFVRDMTLLLCNFSTLEEEDTMIFLQIAEVI